MRSVNQDNFGVETNLDYTERYSTYLNHWQLNEIGEPIRAHSHPATWAKLLMLY